MGNKMKYVIINYNGSSNVPFLFPEFIQHHRFYRILKNAYYGVELVSAGKASAGKFIDGSSISAIPESVSLDVKWSKERQEEDTRIIRRALGDD